MNFEILSGDCGYGCITTNGTLGYDRLAVQPPKSRASNCDTEYISAHATSKIMVKIHDFCMVYGFISRGVRSCGYTIPVVNGQCGGVLKFGGDTMRPIELPPGTHTLEFFANENKNAHSVWGITTRNELTPDDIVEWNVLPGIEILTNARCPRACPGCNQEHWMKSNRDYEYTVENAKNLVAALEKYRKKVDLVFSGGEPRLWSCLDEVMAIFRDCPNVRRTQLTTSQYDEKYIEKVCGIFDKVCVSVRSDAISLLGKRPSYMRSCELWNCTFHNVDIQYTIDVKCNCTNCGITTCLVGDTFVPCTTACELKETGKWPNMPIATLDDFLSGLRQFGAVSSFEQCHVCVNNHLIKHNLVRT